MKRFTLAALTFACLTQQAIAGPADYVHTPHVEEGEFELGIKAGSYKPKNGPRQTVAAVGLSYGLTSWWSSELYIVTERLQSQRARYQALEWENVFQLTERCEYAADFGFLTELERPRERSEGHELTFGPLMETHFGNTKVNLNLLFCRDYRVEERQPTQLGYQFQTLIKWKPNFGLGVQAFGEVGRWDRWAPKREQSHRIGPAIFGALSIGELKIGYDAALLFEATNEVRGNTLRMELGYEF